MQRLELTRLRWCLMTLVQTLLGFHNAAIDALLLEFIEASARPDWPGAGHLDLKIHDLPHCTAAIEWWYYNMHFTCSGKDVF